MSVSVGEVSVALDQAKETISKAPFAAAAEVLGKTLHFTGLDDATAGINAIRENLKKDGAVVQGVRDRAMDAKDQVDAVNQGASHGDWLDGASGSLGYADEMGEYVQNGMEYMGEKLAVVLGHLAAAQTALNEYNEAQEIAVENIGTGQTAAQVAAEQITSYQAEIAASS